METLVVIDRVDAAAKGSLYYFTGLPCKYGHVAKRYVTTGGCLDCLKKYKVLRAKSHVSHDLIPYNCPTFWRSKRLSLEQLTGLNKYVQTAIDTYCAHMLPQLCKTCDGTHYVPRGDGTNNWKLCPDCPVDIK